MNKNDLNLNQLTMEDIDFSSVRGCMDEYKQIEKEYQAKYRDDWWEHYLADTHFFSDTDSIEETINRAIYRGYQPCICLSGDPKTLYEIDTRYWEKMKRLFGPFYKKYIRHEPDNPKVNKALLKDALKSGKWKELPEELQDEYHKLAGE